jgi:hydroxypyruvate reductase
MLSGMSQNDLLIVLVSGGGSALLTAPVEGVSLQDIQLLTDSMLRSGGTINELNVLRKHLDSLKGGGLARLAAPASLLVLVLSDVIGDPLDVIASGPASPDPSTYADCWEILERYNLLEKTPASILRHLEKGLQRLVPETPKPGDPVFTQVRSHIIANNYMAASAALDEAVLQGFNSLLMTSSLQGEAREAGKWIAAIARQIRATGQPLSSPACLLAGGETTVTVKGDGKGGRNMELALGSLAGLAGLEDVMLVALATDGGDGPTDSAGAIVTGETFSLARAAGLNPDDFLRRSDSYHFFEHLDSLLKTGPTMTNVNDLTFLFVF